jgi:hypothetical protein
MTLKRWRATDMTQDTEDVVADLVWKLEQAVEYDTRLQEIGGVSAVAICTAGERRLAARQSLSDRIDVKDAALEWYAEQVAGCRKLGSIGDPYRQALDRDGGGRARAALHQEGISAG